MNRLWRCLLQVTMLTSRKVFLACLSLGQKEEMGGLVGIGFSIRINPTHTKIHVFITTFRASRLCLILTTAKCLVPGGGAQITLYPLGTAYWLLIKGSVKAHWLMTIYAAWRNDIRKHFLSDDGAALILLFLFENGDRLLSLLLAARWLFLPERYHHKGVLAHKSLQVKT